MSSAVMWNLSRGPETALPCASQSVERTSGTMSSVAPKLRAALERAGITARDLAAKIGMDESTVSLWLSGQRTPRMKNLEKVARALGIEMAELWNGPEAIPANAAQLAVLEDMAALPATQQEAIAAMVRAARLATAK